MKKLGQDFSMKLGFRSRTSAQTDSAAEETRPSGPRQFLQPNGCDIPSPEIRSDKANRQEYWALGEQQPHMLEKQNRELNAENHGYEYHEQQTKSLPRRPKLSKKSISDLTSLSSVKNMKILVEGRLVVDTFVNANNNVDRSSGSNGTQWEQHPYGAETKDEITSESSLTPEDSHKKRFMKRSKSFSGWLSGKTKWKQNNEREESKESAQENAEDIGAQPFKRSGSFSEKIMGKMKFFNKGQRFPGNSAFRRRNSGPLFKPSLEQRQSSDLNDYKTFIPVDYRRRMSDQSETRRLAAIKEPTTHSTSRLNGNYGMTADVMWNDAATIPRGKTASGGNKSSTRPSLTHKGNSDLTDYNYLIPFDYHRRMSDQTESRRLNHPALTEQIAAYPAPGTSGIPNQASCSLDRALVKQKRTNLTRKRSNSLERLRDVPQYSNQLDVFGNMQRSSSCGARLSFTEPSDTHLDDDGTLETNLCTTEL